MTTSPPPQNKLPLIRASELAHYGFCHRAWWLSQVKKWPATRRGAQVRGQKVHSQHAQQLKRASQWRWLGVLMLGGGAVLLVAFLWLWFI